MAKKNIVPVSSVILDTEYCCAYNRKTPCPIRFDCQRFKNFNVLVERREFASKGKPCTDRAPFIEHATLGTQCTYFTSR